MSHFLGLRTVAYRVGDMATAKAWYTEALGIEPYFDEPYYVGFNVAGYELGIVPIEDTPTEGLVAAQVENHSDTGIAYWGVDDADAAYARLLSLGAFDYAPIEDVGSGIRIGAVRDPFGNVFGVIYNPHFKLP